MERHTRAWSRLGRHGVGVVVVAGAAAAVAACSSSHRAATRRSATTTPTTASTTAGPPPALPGGVGPLTGLAADPAVARRPALVVKLDNAPKARPQAGLNQADIVIEEKVEDGVTRFFTIFQSHDADPVGPVRSARSTDIALVTPLDHPLFAYSGTNAEFQKLVSAAPLVDVGVGADPGAYGRRGDRPAPYNLFTSTSALYRRTPGSAKPPPPLLPFRPAGQSLTIGAGLAPASSVHIEFRGAHITTVVDFAWDGGAGVWRRSEDGKPHTDTAGIQVTPKNVVIEFVDYVDTGLRDRSNTPVPEGKVIGGGEAWVLTDGKIVRGRWSKPSAEAVTTYTDGQGAAVPLTPGQTWIELPPPGSATTR